MLVSVRGKMMNHALQCLLKVSFHICFHSTAWRKPYDKAWCLWDASEKGTYVFLMAGDHRCWSQAACQWEGVRGAWSSHRGWGTEDLQRLNNNTVYPKTFLDSDNQSYQPIIRIIKNVSGGAKSKFQVSRDAWGSLKCSFICLHCLRLRPSYPVLQHLQPQAFIDITS